MDIKQIHDIFLQCSGVSTDTRKIIENSMFVAIKGERFDANTFAAQALEHGATYAIIDNSEFYIDERTILVDDSLTALQELAKFHRHYLKIPIVALTGSNGKTTTKELINAVLSKRYTCTATVGNLNNHIGVPLTLLSFTSHAEIGIVEMGANHQKEIEFLCSIAEPDYGYITNFGKAHLEGFGGAEGVIKGKSEMYDYLRNNKKTVFVNLDDAIQVEKSAGIATYTFGLNKPVADLIITEISANPFVTVSVEGHRVSSNLIGLYNANNICAAMAIGKYFDVSDEDIKDAIESYTPDNNRSQLMAKGSNEIILDAYNANPSSMAVAIENFLQLDKNNRIAILGDMFELGEESLFEHASIVSSVAHNDNVKFIFVGKDFYAGRIDKSNIVFLESFDMLSDYLKNNTIENSMVLIKGSRGMALERSLDYI